LRFPSWVKNAIKIISKEIKINFLLMVFVINPTISKLKIIEIQAA
jgi:hypothetical protein